jgi:hypothetical protein
MYLIKRGKEAVRGRRRAHLAKYDAHGEIIGTWCGSTLYDTASNVPWGLSTCRNCYRKSAQS